MGDRPDLGLGEGRGSGHCLERLRLGLAACLALCPRRLLQLVSGL